MGPHLPDNNLKDNGTDGSDYKTEGRTKGIRVGRGESPYLDEGGKDVAIIGERTDYVRFFDAAKSSVDFCKSGVLCSTKSC